MLLKDIKDITKEEFLELFARCELFNYNICEDVQFDIIDDNICVNLSDIHERNLIVPDFIDGIIGSEYHNLFLRELDLNKVKVIYKNGLENFTLTSIKADNLERIESYGLSNNGQLFQLEFPKLKYLGYRALDRCCNLRELKAEELLKMDSYVFDETFLDRIYAPKISEIALIARKIWVQGLMNFELKDDKVIEVDFGDISRNDLYIDKQLFKFKDIHSGEIINLRNSR